MSAPADPRLDELGRQYGADKSSLKHNYLERYEAALAPVRASVKTLIEIGVFRGASLQMWRDYFPGARIVGVDIEPKALRFADDRIAIEIGRQEDPVFLQSLLDKYGAPDVIVDDGSHFWAHQIATFRVLYPAMARGGVYIVEDLHTSQAAHAEKYGAGATQTASRFLSGLAASVAAGGAPADMSEDAFAQAFRAETQEMRFGSHHCIVTRK